MKDSVHRSWSTANGRLVFDVVLHRHWREGDAGTPARAVVTYKSEPVEVQTVEIDRDRPTPFKLSFKSGWQCEGTLQEYEHIHIDGRDCLGVFADIRSGGPGAGTAHFEGLMVTCPSSDTPAPKPPLPPRPIPPRPIPIAPDEDEPDPIPPLAAGPMDELFPYIYLRRWPRVDPGDLTYGFAAYVPGSPPSAFVDQLAAASRQGREALQALSLAFVDGQAPYAGIFISSVHDLQGPVATFPRLADHLGGLSRGDADAWLAAVRSILAERLEALGLPADYFSGAAYAALIDRVWQSYFALAVLMGYEPDLAADLGRVLWLAHVIACGGAPDRQDRLDPHDIRRMARASLHVPATIFPPPAAEGGSPPPTVEGTMAPYAVGDLQMVRHRLRGYGLGEIARIETVLRGERRELSTRRLQREEDYQSGEDTDMRAADNDDAETRGDLIAAVRRAIAETTEQYDYDKLDTTYGPPTQGTMNGSWKRTDTQTGKPGAEDATRFAREVVSRSVGRMARTVGALRARGAVSQIENLASSVIDNTAGDEDRRAVYRWVNKIYEAGVVNYGQRLMLEFLIPTPAADYLADRQTRAGPRGVGLLSPADRFGIDSFHDIEVVNYAEVCAYYGVDDPRPPPPLQTYVTAILRTGEERSVAVPTGYVAADASVTAVVAPDGFQPQVLVGSKQIQPGAPAATPLSAYGEAAGVPVAVLGVSLASPPAGDAQAAVSIEIRCLATPQAQDAWRIAIYGAVARAFQARMLSRASLGEAGWAGGARSSLACRQIERRALKAACSRLVLQRVGALTDGQGSPPAGFRQDPRGLQFVDQSLEWQEMVYSFPSDEGCTFGDLDGVGDGQDPLFVNFLQARQARVLLPVRPERLLAFLYFSAAGAIWEGADNLAPVTDQDLALVNELRNAPSRTDPRLIGETWPVVTPTTLQVVAAWGDEAGERLEFL